MVIARYGEPTSQLKKMVNSLSVPANMKVKRESGKLAQPLTVCSPIPGNLIYGKLRSQITSAKPTRESRGPLGRRTPTRSRQVSGGRGDLSEFVNRPACCLPTTVVKPINSPGYFFIFCQTINVSRGMSASERSMKVSRYGDILDYSVYVGRSMATVAPVAPNTMQQLRHTWLTRASNYIVWFSPLRHILLTHAAINLLQRSKVSRMFTTGLLLQQGQTNTVRTCCTCKASIAGYQVAITRRQAAKATVPNSYLGGEHSGQEHVRWDRLHPAHQNNPGTAQDTSLASLASRKLFRSRCEV
jgi:hypothetical protein